VIAKISKGGDFGGVLRYLYGPGRHAEHEDPHRVAGNVIGDDPRTLAETLRETTELNGRVGQPVWHASLRLAPEDRGLSDAEWARASETFLRRVGFLDERHPGRDTPFVAVRHGDDHVHLVVSRVRFDGTVARDSFDYCRAHQGARAVEAELGLVDASERRGRGGRLAAVTIAERESAARRGVDPERAGLREAVRDARDASGGTRTGFETALEERGVLYRANVAPSTGRMHGYSFSRQGWVDQDGEQVWVPASKVGKELRWAQLGPEVERAGAGRQSEVGRLAGDQEARRVAELVAQSFPEPLRLDKAVGSGRTPHRGRESEAARLLRERQERERADRDRGRGR
jgi:hypothetical protein